jgi:hypothetical protein
MTLLYFIGDGVLYNHTAVNVPHTLGSGGAGYGGQNCGLAKLDCRYLSSVGQPQLPQYQIQQHHDFSVRGFFFSFQF